MGIFVCVVGFCFVVFCHPESVNYFIKSSQLFAGNSYIKAHLGKGFDKILRTEDEHNGN